MGPAQLNATFDDAVALGVGWIRSDFDWSAIEPTSGTFKWSAYDRVVAAANAHHLTVLAVLTGTPVWARPASCQSSEFCAPANPASFAVFAGAAAARYATLGVHDWEIWNEPNGIFWLPKPDPAAYVALLRATAPAIKTADPTATLISGGLAPAPSNGTTISELSFLQAFCSLGGTQLVDAIGYHPYSYPVPPAYPAAWNAWWQMASTTTSVESVLAKYDAASKPLWLTEYGAPTNGPGPGATTANFNIGASADHVSEQLQAQMATAAVRQAATAPYVAALFWYTNVDLGTSTSTVENFFGLRRLNGTPKPAWFAFQTAIAAARSGSG